jgi:hypothetical protein
MASQKVASLFSPAVFAGPRRLKISIARLDSRLQNRENAALFLSFPYVCPEPVLAK